MKIVYCITHFLLIGLSAVIAQPCIQPLGPADDQQLNSYDANSPALVFGQDSIPYVAFSDGSNGGKATVKKYNGTYWENVGPRSLSAGTASHTDLAIDGKGNLYLAYWDATNEDKITVLKYNGSSWSRLGNSFSSPGADYMTLALSIVAGHPVVVYEDAWQEGKATVKVFDGAEWLNVGPEGFSEGQVNYCDIAVDAFGYIYVAYQNESGNNFKGVVARFDGSNWNYVGSSIGFENSGVEFISLAVTPAGTLYVAYQGPYGAGLVKTCNGSTWTQLGSQLAGTAWYTSITLNKQGIPYVTYFDNGYQGKAMVKKYENNAWAVVGAADFTPTAAEQLAIKVNGKGEPYIVYTDGDFYNPKAYVMKYTDGNWILVGDAGLSPGNASFTDVAVDSDGTPYVVYSDVSNGGRATVIRYENNAWTSVSEPCSNGAAQYNQIAIDQNGFPYVIFYDAGINNRVMAMMYNGTSWLPMDTSNLSRGSFIASMALDDGVSPASICIGNTGIPYIAYSDAAKNGKVTVMKYESDHWDSLGAQGFSLGSVDGISLAVDLNEVPYVFYREWNNLVTIGKTKKFDGTSWVIVGDSSDFINNLQSEQRLSLVLDSQGNPSILYGTYNYIYPSVKTFKSGVWETLPFPTNSTYYYQEMAIDVNDKLYVVQCNDGNDFKATLTRYDNNTWITLGTSDGYALYPSLAFGPSGKGYMAFTNDKVFAYEIDCPQVLTAVVNETDTDKSSMATLYPNPNNGLFTLELSEEATVLITNSNGFIVSTESMSAGQHTIDLSNYAKGIYLMKVSDQEKYQTIKVVKE